MTESASVLDERKESLEARGTGLGGTDISAVVSMNPWKNALDVYLGKLGLSEPKDVSEAMEWGNYQEDGIRQAYARRTGWKVLPVSHESLEVKRIERWGPGQGQVLIRHPERPYVLGSPDGIVPDAARGLEIKTCAFKNQDWGKPGSDEVPVHYLLQCAQYMAITGLATWDLAVLFSGNRLEVYTLHRNREIEEQILAAADWFWKTHVEPKVPPPVDGSESCSRWLAKKYALGNQAYVDATAEITSDAEGLKQIQFMLKQAESDERKLKNILADFIGENKGCYFPDGSRAQWVRPKPTEVVDYEGYAAFLETLVQDFFRGDDWKKVKGNQFTESKANTPYIRLYESTKNEKRLKK